MLCSFARQSRLHQTRGPLGDDDLIVQGDVITMRVRDEGEALRVPRIEPQVLLRQVNAALSDDFQFRKTKLFFLSEKAPKPGETGRQTTSTLGGKSLSGSSAPAQKTLTLQDVPITFERQYRLFGAVTRLDQRQRFGDYF